MSGSTSLPRTKRPQITRWDIFQIGANKIMTAVTLAVAEDLVAAKSEKTPLYLLIDDNAHSKLKWILASYYPGGAYGTLAEITEADGLVVVNRSRRFNVHDPEMVAKIVKMLSNFPTWLIEQEESYIAFTS